MTYAAEKPFELIVSSDLNLQQITSFNLTINGQTYIAIPLSLDLYLKMLNEEFT